jgi:DNA-binding HxlR family transcriptional regulator
MNLITAIPDISHKMLTSTLKHLEEDHLILREAYAEIPPHSQIGHKCYHRAADVEQFINEQQTKIQK